MADREEFETVIGERLAKNVPKRGVEVNIDTVIIMDGGLAEIASEVKNTDDV